MLAEAGNPLQAIKYIDQALRFAPHRATFHANRGEILRRWGLLDEGLDACRRAALLEPNSAEVRNNLGLALLGKGAFEEALAHIRAALGLRAQLPQAHFNLGRALKGVGQWQDALAALETVVMHAPDYAEAWCELATVQERMNDPQAALSSASPARSPIACLLRRHVRSKPPARTRPLQTEGAPRAPNDVVCQGPPNNAAAWRSR